MICFWIDVIFFLFILWIDIWKSIYNACYNNWMNEYIWILPNEYIFVVFFIFIVKFLTIFYIIKYYIYKNLNRKLYTFICIIL